MAVAVVPGQGADGQKPRRRWRYWMRQSAWTVVDLVFPPHCAGCGRPGQRFCKDCQGQLEPLRPPFCETCGYPVDAAGKCQTCLTGARTLPALAGIRSAFFHAGPLRRAIHQFKYRRDGILADTLATWMLVVGEDGLVVPVPLAAERLAERGYNQAGLLARAYAELHGLPCVARAVRRTRHTESQVGLSVAQRQRNVAGAFQAEPGLVSGHTIMLVDDVCTTGATLEACAAALMTAGAARVWGLTLARARLLDPSRKEKRISPGAVPGQTGAEA